LDHDESRSAATAAAHAQEFLPFLAARGAVAGGGGAGAAARHPRNEGGGTPFVTPPSGTRPASGVAATSRQRSSGMAVHMDDVCGAGRGQSGGTASTEYSNGGSSSSAEGDETVYYDAAQPPPLGEDEGGELGARVLDRASGQWRRLPQTTPTEGSRLPLR
jgi:hypothetical protein